MPASSLYDKLLKLKDELKNKPDEKPKLKRVVSILMRRYDYGVDDMEEYIQGRDRIQKKILNEWPERKTHSGRAK